ncbi:MAG: DUF4922 domain-containing protein [Candidatus Competibacter sp.]|nr:DUF4922 domain-containing protein [Candidatus Competibacter sp.]
MMISDSTFCSIMSAKQRLAHGALWSRVQRRQEEALASGALKPIDTALEFIEDDGVRFLVRVVANLARKDADRLRQVEQSRSSGASTNPFLPYEEALFVADLSTTHLTLLNKFNVIDHHLLIVTRRFVQQETLLDLADFQALCQVLAEREGLGFYNGGAAAGASQPHKHLQWVPLPLVDAMPWGPFDTLLRDAVRGGAETVPGLPFRHAFAALDPALAERPFALAEVLHERYQTLLQRLGIGPIRIDGEIRQSGPYNLLVTRDWLLLVPRRQEEFAGISINALGFVGSLFVRNQAQLDTLKSRGPMAVLRAVT